MSATAVVRSLAAASCVLGTGLALVFVGVHRAEAVEHVDPTAIDGALRLSGTPVAMTVTPDTPAYWAIGITTAPVTVRSLLGAVTATEPSGTTTHALTIAVSSCTAPWQQTSCTGAEHRVLQPTPINALTGTASPITATTTIPAKVYLLATVTQSIPTAAPETSAVTIRVSATGTDPATAHNTRTPTGTLAYTGTRLTLCTLAAALSVTTGTLLARLGPRHAQKRRP
ncbi:hypothetical protein P9139_03030 [Curtobacterium flaccumfaciens]|nr:hypothetical protein P9139_03030 [Curtobacterium flaccumfaciens]